MWLLGSKSISMIIIMVIMSIFSVQDILRKRISYSLSMMVMGIFVCMFAICVVSGKLSLTEMLVRTLPGIIVYGMAILTREAIGKGDAVVLVILGLITDTEFVIFGLVIALWIGAVFSAVVLMLKIKNKNDTIPFIPFLSIGAVMSYLVV